MRLRTLKKLSRRAAPYLYALGDTRDTFPAEKESRFHDTPTMDERDADRIPLPFPGKEHMLRYIKTTEPRVRRGTTRPYVILAGPAFAKKGTIFVPANVLPSGIEWEEDDAYSVLVRLIEEIHIRTHKEDPEADRGFMETPTRVFKEADRLMARKYCQSAKGEDG